MLLETMNHTARHVIDIVKVSGVIGAVFASTNLADINLMVKLGISIMGLLYVSFKLYRAWVEHRWDQEDRRREHRKPKDRA